MSYHDIINPLRTPDPNIGKCKKTGKWDNENQIKECKKCLKKSTSGYPYFYCDGNCTSEYDIGGGSCSVNSLVAKTDKQCEKPCYQTSFPHANIKSSPEKSDKKLNIKSHIKKNDEYFNILKLINDCTFNNSLRICLNDVHEYSCKDIDELIKKNIEFSKENGTYENERKKIVDIFKKIKQNPNVHNKTYTLLNDTMKTINCIIKEIHEQYKLKDDEKINLIDLREATRKYINYVLNRDKVLKESLLRKDSKFYKALNNGENDNNCSIDLMKEKNKNIDTIKIYISVIIILIIIIILLLIFYRSNYKNIFKN